MKFQKTLLAASLAVAAVATNAQQANPVQVTEGLVNTNPIYANGFVNAPVHGYHATQSAVIDQDIDWLPTIVSGAKSIDLGTGTVSGTSQPGVPVKYDVFKYITEDGTTVYRFESTKDGSKIPGTYVADVNGTLTEYTGTSEIDPNTLQKGGQIEGATGSTVVTGFENRQVNGEHVLYGYQGGSTVNAGSILGEVVAPDGTGTNEYLNGVLGAKQNISSEVRYVQQGILANTGAGPAIDPSKNIYGVSARDNNNVVMMTGNGIALADLSNKGTLQTDGSVASSKLKQADTQGVQKTREYLVEGNKRILEVYNNDAGRELEPKYYEIIGNGQDLVEWKGTTPVLGTHIKTGTAEFNSGIYDVSKVHNTVTNKNVTYSESVSVVHQDQVKAGITTPKEPTTDINKTFTGTTTSETKQQVSTGVIGTNDDKSNKYGTEVSKTVTADGKTTVEKTTITAGGITTTGVINAADFLVDGKSIVQNIETSVGEATQEVVTKVETQLAANQTFVTETVAAVETKVAAVETGLTAAATDRQAIRSEFAAADTATLASANAYTDNAVAGFNSRVGQLNSRIDDVEKTSYRGVAIALAAQQQIPNIGAGQFAVFGGVGHYEGESAGALGVASVFADGRTSLSAALGFAGGSEVGGRVGLSYVFGGK